MRENLTDKRVSAMRAPERGRKEVFDTVKTGLCFRLTSNDARSWSVVYRINGKQLRHTLGPYPLIGVAKARTLAGAALDLVGQGIDPRHATADARTAEAARDADTVEAVTLVFIEKHAVQRRWGELKRVMQRDVVARWRQRPVSSITRRDVIELLDDIAERAPVQANRTLTVLSIFFGWCLDRDIISADPTGRVRKPTVEASRERVLGDAELKAFWIGCDNLGQPFGPLFKLLALTAQRKSEISELTWAEINTKDAQIELSAARYKTGKPHLVPLSKAATAIIEKLPKMGAKPHYVFTTNAKTPVSGFSRAKENLDAFMTEELKREVPEGEREKFELQQWIIHDLRRTARTGFSRLGVAADIGERVLGHAVPGLRGVYDRHTFTPQMRDALDRWALHLAGVVSPKPTNVVSLKRGAKR